MSHRPGRHPMHRFKKNSAMPSEPVPLRIEPAPDPVDRDLEPLLTEPFASAWATDSASVSAPMGALRGSVLSNHVDEVVPLERDELPAGPLPAAVSAGDECVTSP